MADMEDFAERWEERAEEIMEQELAPEACRDIYRSFESDFHTLRMSKPMALTGWDAEQEFRAVEGKLQTALSTAESQYKLKKQHWYEKVLNKLYVVIGNKVSLGD